MSNLKKFQALLIENGYDAAIVTDPLNQQYLSGFAFDDGAVLVLQKDAYLLTDFRYVEAAKEKACRDMQILTPEKGVRQLYLLHLIAGYRKILCVLHYRVSNSDPS